MKRASLASPLSVNEDADSIIIVTGPLKVELDKKRFNVFRNIRHDGNRNKRFDPYELVAASAPEGVRLVDEKGKVFAISNIPPESVRVEEKGPQKAVLRVTGQYASSDGTTCMR